MIRGKEVERQRLFLLTSRNRYCMVVKEMVVSVRLKFVQNRLYECTFFSDPGTIQAIDEYRKSMESSRLDNNRCSAKKTSRALILRDSEIQRELSRFVAEKL